MADDPRVQQLLDELLDSPRTPEEVCENCPELLPVVRHRWQQVRRLRADLNALFPLSDNRTLPHSDGTALPRIPGYEIEAVLGRGGMGIVFRARHLRLNRPVAIKTVLEGGYAGPRERERFQREAEAVAALRHPNVVQIYDVGEEDGRPYFTMELVEGGSLAQKLAGTPQPADPAAELVATLAGAVQSAHHGGIVHRDLKPANVLLTGDGTPKISDFGLARRLEGGEGLTQSGVPVGTPSYMAPEQARGQTHAIGPAADVYALGAVLYELLTGRPPFRAATAAETIQQVISQEPAQPSRLNARVPRDLETICLKCLHKDPGRRYVSAAALADDLGRFRRREPIAARPVGTIERAVRWVRRHPESAATGLTGLVVAIGVLAGGLWLLADRAARARAAESHLEDVGRALDRSDWAGAETALERARDRLAGGGPADTRDRLDRSDQDLRLGVRLDNIQQNLSGMWLFGDKSAELHPDRDYQAAFEEAGLGTLDDPPELVAERVMARRVHRAVVAALDYWSLSNNADDRWRRWAQEVARKADRSSAWRNRFRDARVRSDLVALTELTRSEEVGEQSVSTLLALAYMLKANGGDAIGFMRRLHASHPTDFWIAHELGAFLRRGKDPEAAGYFRTALAIRPRAVFAIVNLGLALGDQGREAEAMECWQSVLRLEPNSEAAHNNLAIGLFDQGRLDEAVRHAREVIRVRPGSSNAHALLGRALLKQGRFDEGRSITKQGLELQPSVHRDYMTLTLRRCERLSAIEDRLPGVTGKTDTPTDPAHLIDFADLCVCKGLHATAARLYAAGLAADQQVVDLDGTHRRYQAACSAARAGCGVGSDAARLEARERAALRNQALAWLRAEWELLAGQHVVGSTEEREAAVRTLRRWQLHVSLEGVRDPTALDRLDEAERREWYALWEKVEWIVAGDAVPTIQSARAHAARGGWVLAAQSYARLFRLTPNYDGEIWFEFAATQLLAGDRDGYRRTCGQMLDLSASRPGTIRPYHAARACTLDPAPVAEASLPGRLSETELRAGSQHFWSLTEQGALAHRAGRSQQAVPLFEQSVRVDPRPGRAVLNWLWLSLANQRLGKSEEAQGLLNRARKWLDQYGNGMPARAEDDLGLHLHNWLEAHVLRREAESLIRPTGPRTGTENRDGSVPRK